MIENLLYTEKGTVMRKLILNACGSEEKLRTIQEAGWDGVFTGWNTDGDFGSVAKMIRNLGLIYQSVHAPFINVYTLWEEGEAGEKELETQVNCLRYASCAEVDLVIIHAIIGMNRCTPTEVGIERFGKIIDEANHLGVRIAVENTEGEIYLEALMNAFKGESNFGFCIDTGHEMCYNYSHDLIGKYGDRLFGTHLNDNMGMSGDKLTWLDDLHMLPFDGIADWDRIATRLKKAGYQGVLTFELNQGNRPERHTNDRYEKMTYREYVTAAYEHARCFASLMGD